MTDSSWPPYDRGGRSPKSFDSGESWAIVLAAGGGTRFGGPKQFADLAGRPMLDHAAADTATTSQAVNEVLNHVSTIPRDQTELLNR
jgi:CTP:molybdopterin cytidylyltransferase MocA